jgi:hypothetical protein
VTEDRVQWGLLLETLGYIRRGIYFDQSGDCKLFKKEPAPWVSCWLIYFSDFLWSWFSFSCYIESNQMEKWLWVLASEHLEGDLPVCQSALQAWVSISLLYNQSPPGVRFRSKIVFYRMGLLVPCPYPILENLGRRLSWSILRCWLIQELGKLRRTSVGAAGSPFFLICAVGLWVLRSLLA